ncbi:hypothetical protein EE612_052353, partial [Oryza sativa]
MWLNDYISCSILIEFWSFGARITTRIGDGRAAGGDALEPPHHMHPPSRTQPLPQHPHPTTPGSLTLAAPTPAPPPPPPPAAAPAELRR